MPAFYHEPGRWSERNKVLTTNKSQIMRLLRAPKAQYYNPNPSVILHISCVEIRMHQNHALRHDVRMKCIA